jgi:hypothetical protein
MNQRTNLNSKDNSSIFDPASKFASNPKLKDNKPAPSK